MTTYSIDITPWEKCAFFNDDVRNSAKFTHVYREKDEVHTVFVIFNEASPMAPDKNVLQIILKFNGELWILEAKANLSFEMMRDALRFSIKERETKANYFLGLMGIPEWVLDPPCRKIVGKKREGLPLVSTKGKLRAGNNVSLYSFKATSVV